MLSDCARIIGFVALLLVPLPIANAAQAQTPAAEPTDLPAQTTPSEAVGDKLNRYFDFVLPEKSPLWDPDWRRASWPEVAAFAGIGLAGVVGSAVIPARREPLWRGGILWDDAIQNRLMVTGSAADVAPIASDIGLYVLLAAPLVDAAATAGWARNDRRTAFELAVMDLEAQALTSTVVWALKAAIGRERPLDFHRGCFDPALAGPSDPACAKAKNTSFPSNHAASSFTSAVLMCTQHAHIALYGNVQDQLVCVEALVLATGVSIARVMGDTHYTSDIVVGAAIGALSGWAVPNLLHFRAGGQQKSTAKFEFALMPLAAPSGVSLTLFGVL